MLIFRFRKFCYFQVISLALVEFYHLCDKVKQLLALSCHCFKFLLGHFVVVRNEPLKFVCHSNDNSEWSAQLVCDAAIEFLAFAVSLLKQNIPFLALYSGLYQCSRGQQHKYYCYNAAPQRYVAHLLLVLCLCLGLLNLFCPFFNLVVYA